MLPAQEKIKHACLFMDRLTGRRTP